MIKRFCDNCEAELDRNCVSERVFMSKGDFRVQIMVAKNQCWNAGELCLKCLLDLLKNGKVIKE